MKIVSIQKVHEAEYLINGFRSKLTESNMETVTVEVDNSKYMWEDVKRDANGDLSTQEIRKLLEEAAIRYMKIFIDDFDYVHKAWMADPENLKEAPWMTEELKKKFTSQDIALGFHDYLLKNAEDVEGDEWHEKVKVPGATLYIYYYTEDADEDYDAVMVGVKEDHADDSDTKRIED